MGEKDNEQRRRDKRKLPKPIPLPVPETVGRDLAIDGVTGKRDRSRLTSVSDFVQRAFSYLIGWTGTVFKMVRCTDEGYLLVQNVGGCPDRFGDSLTVDGVTSCFDWKGHNFGDVFHHLDVYVYGGYVAVETSLDGGTWAGRGVTKANSPTVPLVSTLNIYVDFRHVRIKLVARKDHASYSIVAQKVICGT